MCLPQKVFGPSKPTPKTPSQKVFGALYMFIFFILVENLRSKPRKPTGPSPVAIGTNRSAQQRWPKTAAAAPPLGQVSPPEVHVRLGSFAPQMRNTWEAWHPTQPWNSLMQPCPPESVNLRQVSVHPMEMQGCAVQITCP